MSKIQGFSAVPIERAQSAIDNYKRLHNEANQAYNTIRKRLSNTVTYHWFGLYKSNAFTDLTENRGWHKTCRDLVAAEYPNELSKEQAKLLNHAGYPREEKNIHKSLKSLIETTTEDHVLCNPTICQFIVDYSDKS